MRLGGPTFAAQHDPQTWISEVRQLGYRAAYCPVDETADTPTVNTYERAAQDAGIVIAEVGAWSNPLSPDEAERSRSIELCQRRLALADAIGARCCVNISGSRGTVWDSPHPDNLTAATFDLIVETTRRILDAVKPRRTFFTLEPMPWCLPDSVDSYLALLHAIDRPGFAVHLDPVNLITSPRLYFQNSALLRDCFGRLGAHIKSCHAKDTRLAADLTVHLSEVRPGLGGLDYVAFLNELNRLDPDTPLMLEHLPAATDYKSAADHVRAVAQSERLIL